MWPCWFVTRVCSTERRKLLCHVHACCCCICCVWVDWGAVMLVADSWLSHPDQQASIQVLSQPSMPAATAVHIRPFYLPMALHKWRIWCILSNLLDYMKRMASLSYGKVKFERIFSSCLLQGHSSVPSIPQRRDTHLMPSQPTEQGHLLGTLPPHRAGTITWYPPIPQSRDTHLVPSHPTEQIHSTGTLPPHRAGTLTWYPPSPQSRDTHLVPSHPTEQRHSPGNLPPHRAGTLTQYPPTPQSSSSSSSPLFILGLHILANG